MIADPWTQRKMAGLRRAMVQSGAGVGDEAPVEHGPPPRGAAPVAMLVGWGAVVAVAAGIFYFTAKGAPVPMRANRRRRRRSSRRTSRRTSRKLAANAPPKAPRTAWMEARLRKLSPSHMNKAIYWGRWGNIYYVEAPNRKVRLYRGEGAKARASNSARDLADRYGMPKRKKDRMKGAVLPSGEPRPKNRRVSRPAPVLPARPKNRRVSRPAPGLPDHMNKVIYWGRRGNSYYVEAPNRNVRLYRGPGAKALASEAASALAKRYGLPKRKSDRKAR